MKKTLPLKSLALHCFVAAFVFIGVLVSAAPSYAQTASLKKANIAFKQQEYRKALKLYRKILRKNPKEYLVWNFLGASYYHTGKLKLALKTLKKVQKKTDAKSQNFYYQGLVYDAAGQKKTASEYLRRAMKGKSVSTTLAAIELAAFFNDKKQFAKARKLLKIHRRNMKKGPLVRTVDRLIRQLDTTSYRPIKESARYKRNIHLYKRDGLSLIESPHHWYFQTGANYTNGRRSNPASRNEGQVKTGVGFEDYLFHLAAGFGLGPYYSDKVATRLGYHYTQQWFTTSERLSVYFDEPGDFIYFPLRPDLQEREHKLFLETYSKLPYNLSLGAYGEVTILRSGSKVYPAPERDEIRKVTTISQGNSLVPWIAWNPAKNQKLSLHIYLNKSVNLEQSEFSFSSYSLGDATDPFFSFALGYEISLMDERLKLSGTVYNLQYLFNDFWEEYERFGTLARARFEIFGGLEVAASLNIYQDQYIYNQIKTGSCGFDEQVDSQDGVSCPRDDTGFEANASLIYNLDKNQSLSISTYFKSHSNPDLRVFDEERLEIYGYYTLAFPGIDSISRYLGRFTNIFDSKEVY